MTKNMIIACLLLGALTSAPTTGQTQELESNGQLLISFARSFEKYEINDDMAVCIYAHGTGFISLRSDPQLFGYFGPKLTIHDSTLQLLTGTYMTGDGGMSLIASLWYNQVLPGSLNLFLEGDVYFPIDGENVGHEDLQYFTVFNLSWSWTDDPDDNTGVGIVQENFFNNEGDVFEAAIGPALNFDGRNFWLAYDFTPNVEGDQIVLRLSLGL